VVAEVLLSHDDEVKLEWNGSVQLGATAYDQHGQVLPGREVQWMTSKDHVVSVDEDGVLRAIGAGTAFVTAGIEGVYASVGVRVHRAPVEEIRLELGSPDFEVGEVGLIGARLKLVSGEVIDGPVVWASSTDSVATVTVVGAALAAIEATNAGRATITASADGVSAAVEILVTPPPTHDLIYNRVMPDFSAEIFVLALTPGAAPVKLNAGNVSRDPSPSPDGTQFVFAVSQIGLDGKRQDDLFIVNRNGLNMRWLTRMPGLEDQPNWSPDGSRILFRAFDEDSGPDLWLINVDGSGLTNITSHFPAAVTDKRDPSWSPDGGRIAFVAAREGEHKIWTMNADGSGAAQLVADHGFDVSPTWSPDGTRIAFSRYNALAPENGWDIMIVGSAGGAPTRLVLPGDQHLPAWSPDGEYIALAGTVEAGRGTANIYTLRPDGGGLRLRTVNPGWGGGLSPAWIKRQ
jgi:tricorn protease-like protein